EDTDFEEKNLKLLKSLKKNLQKATCQDLKELNLKKGDALEVITALHRLENNPGYRVEIVGGRSDGGIDVLVTDRNNKVVEIVSCKQTKSKVPQHIREAAGTKIIFEKKSNSQTIA